MLLEVTDIQQGCAHDGPGLRTTVFLKGCPLHCRWCHNPETQSCKKELYYRPEKCIGCLTCTTVCPKKGHTEKDGVHEFDPTDCIFCMACAQNCPSGALEAVSQSRELEDIMKLVCADRVFYRKRGGLTVSGGEPTVQWEGLIALPDSAKALGQLYQKLSHCRHIELLPYHPYGLSKSEQLGKEGFRYHRPKQQALDSFASVLLDAGIPVKLHGSLL